MEPIEPPWQAIKEWIPDEEPDLDWFNRPIKFPVFALSRIGFKGFSFLKF
jgi:hypothetical protein